jgi:hypothetical protein
MTAPRRRTAEKGFQLMTTILSDDCRPDASVAIGTRPWEMGEAIEIDSNEDPRHQTHVFR